MVEGVPEQEAPEETGDPIKDMDNYRNHHGMDRVFQYLLQVSPPALPPSCYCWSMPPLQPRRFRAHSGGIRQRNGQIAHDRHTVYRR